MTQMAWAGPLAALLFAASGALADGPLTPPASPDNLASLGSKIQRTMTLLATSTPRKPNRVRILFYGQSVTRNPWWQDVFQVTWEVEPLFKDVYQTPETDDPTNEASVTLAQRLTNGKHTLRLAPNNDGPVAVKAFRVYRPPLR